VPKAATLLIDLDGTLYTDAGPIPGAVEAIAELRRRGVLFRFVTNTTRRSRRGLVERLRGYGVEVDPAEVFTSVMAGVRLLRERGIQRVAPFVANETLEDFDDFALVGGTAAAPAAAPAPPAAVVIGDDLWADVAGAQRAGLQGWLVRTGKFREDLLARSEVKPDRVLDSIAEVVKTA
jgi:ribonucleotide monophosphatase NagD (HAD superfamily)